MTANQKLARTAGVLYLILIICGVFAEFGVREGLIVRDDAAATVQNIREDETLFRLGFISDLTAYTVYFMVALTLYALLKTINPNIALLFLLLVVISVPMLCLNMLNQLAALLLLNGEAYTSVLTTEQLNGLILFFLEMHKNGYLIAQIFFGGWLLPLGYLVYKSGYFPKIIGVFLMVAAGGYAVDFFTYFLVPDVQADITEIVLAPAVIGEFSLCLWLLVRGVKMPKVQAVTPLQPVSA